MKLDGYDVEVGDQVYDCAMGPGVVDAIHDDSMVVSFKSHSLTYSSTGHGGFRFRTLYWANPVTSPPSKLASVRDLSGKLQAAINQVLKDHKP